MNQKEKALAEAILRHLCIGRRICGLTFYAIPMLTFDTDDQHSGERAAILTIEGPWALLDEIPADLTTIQWQDLDGSHDWRGRASAVAAAAVSLAWYRVVDARLADEVPHLLITFSNGQALCVHGHRDHYESWNIVSGRQSAGNWFLVVAGPQDDLTIWTPDGFRPGG